MYSVNILPSAFKKIKKLSSLDSKSFYKVVEKLKINPYDHSLKTHKLKPPFVDTYSCSLSFKKRVLFIILVKDSVTIVDIGSHDEVY